MVNTRSQTTRSRSAQMSGMDRYRDAESDDSVPDVLTREQMKEVDDENVLNHRNETERRAVNQRLSEMNRQISELTNLVLALTEKIFSSNREGNVLSTTTKARSDNMTAHKTNAWTLWRETRKYAPDELLPQDPKVCSRVVRKTAQCWPADTTNFN